MQVILCTANPAVSEAVRGAFRGRRANATVCVSSLELLGVVRDAAADLILLDLDTPGVNPLFLISALQEVAPGLPIAAISARSDTDARLLTQRGISFIRLNSHPEVEVRALLAELARRARHADFTGSATR